MTRKLTGIILLAAVLLISALSTAAQTPDKPNIAPIQPVNTFSIICYDSLTGEIGVAVQSHWFKVADVIWAEPGVGAVATQSFADFAYGPLGLEMMKLGKTARQALDGVLASDPTPGVRQVAMLDANGGIVAHTGEKCIAEAGHIVGPNYSVQANLMAKNTVWPAMAAAFEQTDGDLADRMMAALEAAQGEGGDIRGKQSAAMVVVTGDPTGQPWHDRVVDIRVDDSPQPLKELRRLLNITRAYDRMNEGDELLAAGDIEGAASAYEMATELAPGNLEIQFWHAVTLVSVGEPDHAMPIFKEVFAKDSSWRELIPRLVAADLLPDNKKLIETIVGQ